MMDEKINETDDDLEEQNRETNQTEENSKRKESMSKTRLRPPTYAISADTAGNRV